MTETTFERMIAWHKAVFADWLCEAVFAAYIQLPYPADVPVIVGYNPQLLLTARPEAAWSAFWLAQAEIILETKEGFFTSYSRKIPVMFPGDELVFRDSVSVGPMPTRTYHNELMDIVPEPSKRQPDYLKHDPSKRHGRVRRRRW